jgi:diguanylate cyclase (GGDEF)-like protein
VVGSTAYLFGGIDSITASSPWFYIIYILPFISVVFSVWIGRRTLATALIPIVYFVSFFRLDWTRMIYEISFAGVSFNLVAAMTLLSILLGQMIYNLNREYYFGSRERKIQRRKIQELANHDQLTDLYNRRKFEDRLREEFNRAQRYDLDLTVMIIDLDHFKHINDTFGHQAGDRVLEEVGDVIQSTTRRSDLTARYGGEEFCVALPKTELDKALEIAERLREALKERTFHSNGEEFNVTCSIGVAELKDEEQYSSLLERADDLLYDAKHEGRDCVICR